MEGKENPRYARDVRVMAEADCDRVEEMNSRDLEGIRT